MKDRTQPSYVIIFNLEREREGDRTERRERGEGRGKSCESFDGEEGISQGSIVIIKARLYCNHYSAATITFS